MVMKTIWDSTFEKNLKTFKCNKDGFLDDQKIPPRNKGMWSHHDINVIEITLPAAIGANSHKTKMLAARCLHLLHSPTPQISKSSHLWPLQVLIWEFQDYLEKSQFTLQGDKGFKTHMFRKMITPSTGKYQ